MEDKANTSQMTNEIDKVNAKREESEDSTDRRKEELRQATERKRGREGGDGPMDAQGLTPPLQGGDESENPVPKRPKANNADNQYSSVPSNSPEQNAKVSHEKTAAMDGVEMAEHTGNSLLEKTSRCLHVMNLVRPLTKMQLDELLGQAGSLVDDPDIAFWMDRKRSHFYCTYQTAEMAEDAYRIMNGLKFPPVNPRTLSVEFVEESKIKDLIAKAVEFDNGPPDARRRASSHASTAPVDMGPRGVEKAAEGAAEKAVDRKARGMAKAPKEPEKTLDDLFKKTTAEPCIYWLPLTDEQAEERKAKETQRTEREKRRH